MVEKQAHITVSGLVQGVFFRANTKEHAVSLRLTGWVRNIPEGGVEILAEGEEYLINDLIDFLRNSPGSSSVEDLDIKWKESSEEFTNFSINY